MPEPADRYARHTSALGLSAGHEEAFRSLKRILHDGGRFKLVLLQFNNPAYRDALIEKINAAATTPAVLHVSAEAFPEFFALETRLAELARDHAVIHLTGLESWLFPYDAPTRATGFNYHREAIAEHCPAALLLWLTEPDIRDFAVQAPDMWAWRAGVLDFSVVQEEGGLAPPQISEPLEGLSLAQRVKRINEIRNYLATTKNIDVGLQGTLLHELGQLHHAIGKEAEALKYFQPALSIFQQTGEALNEGRVLTGIGVVFRALGQYNKALEFFQRSLAISQETGDRKNEGVSINNLGGIFSTLGKYDDALESFKKGLAISRENADRRNEGMCLNNIAVIYQELGKQTEALETYRQSLTIRREIGDRQGEGSTLSNIAGIDFARGKLDEALETCQQSLAICRETGDRIGEGHAHYNIAVIHKAEGKKSEALEMFRKSLTICRETGDRETEGRTLWNFGTLLQDSDKEQARAYFEQALHIELALKAPQYEKDLTWFNQQFPPTYANEPA